MAVLSIKQRTTKKPASLKSQTLTDIRKRNEKAITLLDRWAADESGYEEKNWNKIKKVVKTKRVAAKSRSKH